MKTALMFVCILSCAFLSAVIILAEDFTSTTFPPTGWTMTGPSTSVWTRSATASAGGTVGELYLNYTPFAYGTYKFISPSFDTRKVHDMTLSFRHSLSDFGTIVTFTVGVMVYSGTTGWNTIWSDVSSTNIPATQVNLTIPYSLGRSEETQIAFFFEGNNVDINWWVIDDISLSYTNTLGEGTWGPGNYDPEGSVIVPNGYTLTLQPGTTINFAAGTSLNVEGRLLANGTQIQAVQLGARTVDPWLGIKMIDVSSANDSTLIGYTNISGCFGHAIEIQAGNKVRIHNSSIGDNSGSTGVGIHLNYADVVIEGCDIFGNIAAGTASGLYCQNSSPVIRNNRIYDNYSESSAHAVQLVNSTISQFSGNSVVNNVCFPSGSAIYVSNGSSVTLNRNLIANNLAPAVKNVGSIVNINNCNIINNYYAGVWNMGQTHIVSSIIWSSSPSQILNDMPGINDFSIKWTCWKNFDLSGYTPAPVNNVDNINLDPLFVNPTPDHYITNDALAADWHLLNNSPCIDTGDPYGESDPDGSRPDMGIYPRYLKPFITRAKDVPFDQGHLLDLKWNRSDLDISFIPQAYYSIWREGSTRNDGAILINDLSQLSAAMLSSDRDVCFRDGIRTYYHLDNVPAMNFADYGKIITTLQDSSSTGTHAANYLVAYHNNSGLWMSVPASGYTVDNIPPSAPDRLDIARTGTGTYNLTWDEVTGGYLDGNFEEEINGITYKVYAGDTCDFIPGPASFLLSTTNPYALLTNQTADHRFYKIIASDSE